RGERCSATEFLLQPSRDGERIVSDAIQSAGNSRNNLEECGQTGSFFLPSARALSYSWIVPGAISSQRNLAAISRLLAESEPYSASFMRRIFSARTAMAAASPTETKNSLPLKICRGPGTSYAKVGTPAASCSITERPKPSI